MEQGPTLAAMLRGAGAMGNPQDVKRATAKRWAKRGAVNGGIPDGSPGGQPGLPPHSGASGMLGAHLAAVPVKRAQPGGSGDNWKSLPPQVYPDSDPSKRPDRARRAPWRTKNGGKYYRHQGDGVFRGKRYKPDYRA